MKLQPIKLLQPVLDEGITVKQALSRRFSRREFDGRDLSLKNLSELLWAIYGVNGPDGHRTAPSALALYPLRVFAVMREGVYEYDPTAHALNPVAEGDYRAATGVQDFVGDAAADIAIYSDYRVYEAAPEIYRPYITNPGNAEWASRLDAGSCAENAYMYCTCAGISIVERMMFDDEKFRQIARLDDKQHFQVAVTVGYPK